MRAFLIVCCCCVYLSGHTQEYTRREPDLSRIADDLYDTRTDDIDYEALYDNLAQWLLTPRDLNTVTAEELRFIHLLSEAQVQSFLAYRAAHSPLLSVYELQAVPGLDVSALQRLAPFVTVSAAALRRGAGKPATGTTEGYVLFRYERVLERSAGYDAAAEDARFAGTPARRYVRGRIQDVLGIEAGFTAENDAGEAATWHPRTRRYGFDYLSGYAQLTKRGKLSKLIVGDYQAQFGQGLVLGGVAAMGQGGETITAVRQSNLGFIPYTSAYEAGYRRGAAATVLLGKGIYINSFASYARRDATLLTDSVTTSVTSFQETGLHRNSRELATRRQTGEFNTGTVLQYKSGALDAGVLVDYIRFDATVRKHATPYNQFVFTGTAYTNTGLYVNYTVDNVTFFSEAAMTQHHGWAATGGVLMSLTPRLDMALLYRRYGTDFYSRYSSAFAESSTPQNETGTYWGLKYSVGKKISAAGYVDLFRFPWLKYRVYAPSTGHAWLLRITYQPVREVTAFIQAREEEKPRNTALPNTPAYALTQTLRRNYRLSVAYGGAALRLKSQVQFCTFRSDGRTSFGSALLQDISIKAGRLRVTGRYALFDTDGYDTRLYAYENDVWLAYSLPAYSGQGVRKYIMVEYAVNRHLTVWLRYGQTRYSDRSEIGTGVDRTDGNMRNDVKFEVRARL